MDYFLGQSAVMVESARALIDSSVPSDAFSQCFEHRLGATIG